MTTNKPMSRKKILLIISVFILILTCVRLIWISSHIIPTHPIAEKGVIDFSQWEFTHDEVIALDGEWAFYPSTFLPPDTTDAEKTYLNVPGDWHDVLPEQGFGTYRLKILLPENVTQLYGIRVSDASTASKIYINENFIAVSGKVGDSLEQYKGELGPYSALFQPNQSAIELIIHVANFDYNYVGGLTKTIKFGTDVAINSDSHMSIMWQLIVCAILLLHSLYAISLYLIGRKQKELLFYSLLLICAVFSILLDNDKILYTWLSIDIKWSMKLMFLSFIGVLFFVLSFIKTVFNLKNRAINFLLILYSILAILLIIMPSEYVKYIGIIVMLTNLTAYTFMFILLFRIIRQGNTDAIFILLSNTGNLINTIWGVGINIEFVNINYYPFDFIISIMAFTFFLFQRHIRISNQNNERADKLLKVDKIKDEFLMNTSHELRNPLHGIINIAQSVLDDQNKTLSAKDKDSLELLIQIGQRMKYTLNDLLDITRLRDQHIQLQKHPVQIHSTVNGVIDMIRFMTNEKSIQLINDIPKDFPVVCADENRLIQILFNLLQNAVKFTHEGTVVVSAFHNKNMATVLVKDTGIGISDDMRQRIFNAYEQKHSNMTMGGGGIGLGLSICKQLIELHGGTISVQSKEDEGSTFSFTLELSEEELNFAETTQKTLPIKSGYDHLTKHETREEIARILIVDDDPVNLSVLSHLLSRDYHVSSALNAANALIEVDKGEWDLVISDVMMPHMSGYELTEKLRTTFSLSELPILLLTARGQQVDIETAFRVGANDYVIKPVDGSELRARVRALTEMKQSVSGQLRMEAAWLQAQIRPHFLFNTLNTIASLAEIDTNRMVALLQELGNYLQRSFATTNTLSLVSLESEIDLTRSYLFIEQQRFGERIKINWELDDHLMIDIPPLSIQPLVENAIEHGILKRARGGTITIKVTDHDTYSRIAITDDGVGMTQANIDDVLSGEHDSTKGIGLPNTHSRLKKLYGKGLSIESKPDCGTTIRMDIPHAK